MITSLIVLLGNSLTSCHIFFLMLFSGDTLLMVSVQRWI